MKYIKVKKSNNGVYEWDFSNYYDVIVPTLLQQQKELVEILDRSLNGIENRNKTFNRGIIENLDYNLSLDKFTISFRQRTTGELILLEYYNIISLTLTTNIVPLTIMAHEVDITLENTIIHCISLLGDTEIIIECEKIELNQ